MNDFIKQQQELARKQWNDEHIVIGGMELETLDILIQQIITNTGEELMRRAEGEKTKNTDGKTYYDGHPDVIKDQAIDTLKKHITNLTGAE